MLVYGMGVIGSIYALRLARAGFAVTGLARGERLASLRTGGLVIHNVLLDETESAAISVVETVPENADFDLVLVAVRSGQVLDALSRLDACSAARAVLVIGNNLEDLDAEAAAAGEGRFLPGFGAFGGYREGGIIHYVDGRRKERPGLEHRARTTLGVLRESARPALAFAVRTLLEAGLPADENPDIHAYLLYHAALVFPLAGAIYAAGGGQERCARTRDAIVLGIRAFKEAFRALNRLGFSLQPKSLKSLARAPEWLLAKMLAKSVQGEAARVAMFGHANAPGGRGEIGGQAAVLDGILRKAGTPLENWNRLLPYFGAQGDEELIMDGARRIRLRLW